MQLRCMYTHFECIKYRTYTHIHTHIYTYSSTREQRHSIFCGKSFQCGQNQKLRTFTTTRFKYKYEKRENQIRRYALRKVQTQNMDGVRHYVSRASYNVLTSLPIPFDSTATKSVCIYNTWAEQNGCWQRWYCEWSRRYVLCEWI